MTVGTTYHARATNSDAHTPFRYVAADKAALDTALAGNHSLDAAGLLAVQADVKKVAYLSTPGNPGTWTTLYPGYTVSASAPTVNEDGTAGFEPGHQWVRTGTPEAYICMSNGTGAADWNQIDAAGGGSIGSGTDNRLARYDGTGAIQDSGITVSDTDAVTGLASINLIGSGADERIARYDGVNGIQSSGIFLNDSREISNVAALNGITVTGTGRFGFGEASPAAALDIVSTGATQLRMSDGAADATIKRFYAQCRHYNVADTDFAIFFGFSLSASNQIAIGGGSAALNSANRVSIYTGATNTTTTGTEVIRADNDTTTGNTRLMVYDVDNAALERVSVGAADSGGAGFKVLRIPN